MVALLTIDSIASIQISWAPPLTTIYQYRLDQGFEKVDFDANIVDIKLVATTYQGVQSGSALLKATVTSPLDAINIVKNDTQVDERGLPPQVKSIVLDWRRRCWGLRVENEGFRFFNVNCHRVKLTEDR